jgi:hypothetical protein
MEPILIRTNRSQSIQILIIGTVTLTFAAWVSGLARPLLALQILLFGVFMPLLLWQLLDRRPRLVVDDRGLSGIRLGRELISWGQVRGAQVARVWGSDHVYLDWVRPGHGVVRTPILAYDLEFKASQIVELIRRRARVEGAIESGGP